VARPIRGCATMCWCLASLNGSFTSDAVPFGAARHRNVTQRTADTATRRVRKRRHSALQGTATQGTASDVNETEDCMTQTVQMTTAQSGRQRSTVQAYFVLRCYQFRIKRCVHLLRKSAASVGSLAAPILWHSQRRRRPTGDWCVCVSRMLLHGIW